MKERPILFSGPMVRAILAGTKTQTRRIVKNETKACAECFAAAVPHNASQLVGDDGKATIAGEVFGTDPYLRVAHCPHTERGGGRVRYTAEVGDRLWVRETWQRLTGNGHRIVYRADGEPRTGPGGDETVAGMTWRPSIFMPRWASRITLEVVSVRVERLQDISEEDAEAEGCTHIPGALHPDDGHFPTEQFRDLWDSINTDRAPWASNPWVWVVEFKRIG